MDSNLKSLKEITKNAKSALIHTICNHLKDLKTINGKIPHGSIVAEVNKMNLLAPGYDITRHNVRYQLEKMGLDEDSACEKQASSADQTLAILPRIVLINKGPDNYKLFDPQ